MIINYDANLLRRLAEETLVPAMTADYDEDIEFWNDGTWAIRQRSEHPEPLQGYDYFTIPCEGWDQMIMGDFHNYANYDENAGVWREVGSSRTYENEKELIRAAMTQNTTPEWVERWEDRIREAMEEHNQTEEA